MREKKRVDFPFVRTCGSKTRVKFQIGSRQMERGVAEERYFSRLLLFCMESCFGNTLMGGELGNEINIDLLGSSNYVANKFRLDRERRYYEFSFKSWCFLIFADISSRSSRIKKLDIFHLFFRTSGHVSGPTPPNFKS